jgi:hypothetical protein
MPKPQVRRVQEINLNNIHLSEISENSYGGKSVYIQYVNDNGDKEDLYIQTPKMHNSWGVHASQGRDPQTKEAIGDPRYYLQLSFGNEPKNSTLKLHEFMNALDEKILKEAKTNCVAWLKVKPSKADAVCKDKYRPTIQFSVDENMDRDNKYPDSCRFKIPFDSETKTFYNTVEVYDEHGVYQQTKRIEDMQQWLTKGSKDIAIVQLSSIYFAGGNFGLSWKVVQIQAFPRSGGIQGFQIQNEDDERQPLSRQLEQEGDDSE